VAFSSTHKLLCCWLMTLGFAICLALEDLSAAGHRDAQPAAHGRLVIDAKGEPPCALSYDSARGASRVG
jgi:hypothetical protein